MSIKKTDTRKIEIYKKTIKDTFQFLKQTRRFDDLLSKNIPLLEAEGFLVPICELHKNDERLINQLSQWRTENTFAYPSQFPVTIEGTKKWLDEKLLQVEDRILFLILDQHGQNIGHLGFANAINDYCEIELDNVLRGIKNIYPGIISSAVITLIKWAQETLSVETISLRVFSDNERAVNFYNKLGFKTDKLIPLRLHQTQNTKVYQQMSENDRLTPDQHFLRMIYKPNQSVDKTQMILTAGPSVSAKEMSYVMDAARNGWNFKHRDYINKFEQSFAQYLGVNHALTTNSCTCAMHLALVTLGIGPGDEVIVPDITWVATANAVVYVGATPVFADIEADSWCLDPASFEAAITEKTKAVMPVHLYGHPARMDKIIEIARKYNLYVIEDAAPALGAECLGQKVATFGDFAAFSFQGAKLLVTGEGGILVTNNEELYKKAWAIWNQGCLPGTFWVTQNGYKYRMSNMQAAFGLGQLERIDQLIEAKRRIFSWYAEGLQDVSQVRLNYETDWARSIYWMSSIYIDENADISRDKFREELKKRNIDTRPVFPAISQYPFWLQKQDPQPTAVRVGNQGVNLPSGVCLQQEQVNYICKSIKDIFR
ncbi:bifunctional GNAT family N-acetyltransferase/PLP-dependent aspartate aminotransferase family protein [Sphaerospermopsis sp. FACHB-1094]|uniref:bifunctional GNAT family N-acetyltransferase/PLP-dependent aspartate aminotransferase family protein n=1 Tax=Sphaerospermopsis sp. FACHB-1094 TaxID=2692861 RepID=UPI0018F045BF|nr:bifunctional GNAT family N-acetyltransferase/PLP-dependent aspartate aminotransferase family protein [Sphaerospermopsis sp. FACHB-1094]